MDSMVGYKILILLMKKKGFQIKSPTQRTIKNRKVGEEAAMIFMGNSKRLHKRTIIDIIFASKGSNPITL